MIDIDALWQTAQEQWAEVDKRRTRLVLAQRRLIETPVPKDELSDEGTSLFEMEHIALRPVGDFVMGYGPRADLLAVQEAQV